MKQRYKNIDISLREKTVLDRHGQLEQLLLVRLRDRRTGRRAQWCGTSRHWRYHVARLLDGLLRDEDD